MKRLSTLWIGLGAVAIGFSLLSFLLTVIFGPFLENAWTWGNLAVGVLLLAVGLITNRELLGALLHSEGARRVGKSGGNSLLATVLSIVILAGVGFLLSQHSLRFDWSETGQNTLAQQSVELLHSLDEDVEIVAFFPNADPPRAVRSLLGRYERENEKIKLVFVDPNQRPDLIQRYKIPLHLLGGGGLVHVAIGDRSENISRVVDVELPDPADLREELSEHLLTNAILRVSKAEARVVYFLEGHGERSAEGNVASLPEGYLDAGAALREVGVRTERLLLLSTGRVPADADLLVIAGPQRSLSGDEVTEIERYVREGGALLLMLEPQVISGLEEMLLTWGVHVGNDMVIDQKQGVSTKAATPLVSLYGDHPITRNLNEATVFHVARSVILASKESTADFVELVFASEDSWAEKNLEAFFTKGELLRDDQDLFGPIPMAVAGILQNPGQEGKVQDGEIDPSTKSSAYVVVFGDADFASNQLLNLVKNRDLFLNTVHWLTEGGESIAIRAPRTRASRFRPTEAQMNLIRILTLFVLPEAIALLGVWVRWHRRTRHG
jgi:ABC-type uncharacterized transport system involved in gliding motility auxiliary subunit